MNAEQGFEVGPTAKPGTPKDPKPARVVKLLGRSPMDESRVDRLIRLAEEAAINGDTDRATTLLEVLRPAIYLRNREIKELDRMMKVTAND